MSYTAGCTEDHISRSVGCGEFDDSADNWWSLSADERLRIGKMEAAARERVLAAIANRDMAALWRFCPAEVEGRADTLSDAEMREIERERAANYAADYADSQMEDL